MQRARTTRRAPVLLWPACAAAILSVGCSSPEPKLWNLDQLHDAESRHRYQVALQSDGGWFLRREVLGIFSGAGAQYASDLDTEAIENPAEECLTNLIELEERGLELESVDPRHVEWFARIAVEDRSRLSRERAVLALGRLGERLAVGLPARLGTDQKPAGPAELAPVLEELVRSVRGLVAGDAKVATADAEAVIAQRVAAVRALDLDLAAGRRALRASGELQRLLATADIQTSPLDDLVVHLEGLLIRRALASAIEDPDDLVRAAAVPSIAAAGGARAIDVVLFDRFRKDRAPRPTRALLELLAVSGLPVAAPGTPPLDHTSDQWIAEIQAVAIESPEGELRVRAMRTLQAVAAPELQSLREEDWLAWWTARRAPANRPERTP